MMKFNTNTFVNIFFIWLEICLVTAKRKDILEFWEPDPKFEEKYRRINYMDDKPKVLVPKYAIASTTETKTRIEPDLRLNGAKLATGQHVPLKNGQLISPARYDNNNVANPRSKHRLKRKKQKLRENQLKIENQTGTLQNVNSTIKTDNQTHPVRGKKRNKKKTKTQTTKDKETKDILREYLIDRGSQVENGEMFTHSDNNLENQEQSKNLEENQGIVSYTKDLTERTVKFTLGEAQKKQEMFLTNDQRGTAINDEKENNKKLNHAVNKQKLRQRKLKLARTTTNKFSTDPPIDSKPQHRFKFERTRKETETSRKHTPEYVIEEPLDDMPKSGTNTPEFVIDENPSDEKPTTRGLLRDKKNSKYKSKNNKRGSKKQMPAELNALDPNLQAYNLDMHLKNLTEKFNCANITKEVIGTTISYNDIILLKITDRRSALNAYFRADNRYAEEGPEKKIIFIVHGLSVMGWPSLLALSDIEHFKELVGYYLHHLDKFDIFLIPMANPDGINMVKQFPLWNKNVAPGSACPGVALDRNFDVQWKERKKSSPCSQQYPGPRPFSESETQAVRSVFHRYGHKMYAYFHVHSGTYTDDFFKGDAVLYPRGYTDQTDDDKYVDLKGEMDENLKEAGFQVISVAMESLFNWYGKVTGTSVDYAATIYGVPYAMELVMQIYEDPESQNTALTQLWRRVIDTIFVNMHKKLQTADSRRDFYNGLNRVQLKKVAQKGDRSELKT